MGKINDVTSRNRYGAAMAAFYLSSRLQNPSASNVNAAEHLEAYMKTNNKVTANSRNMEENTQKQHEPPEATNNRHNSSEKATQYF